MTIVLPTCTELQALWIAVRERSIPATWTRVDPDRVPDERVLALCDDPFTSVDDVHERLMRLEAYFRAQNDRRSIFLTVYATMTIRVGSGIREGSFEDGEWVSEYLVAFAERYRTALLGFERGVSETVPVPWRVAFNAAASGETLLIQDALLAINAHIDYDLTYALLDVGIDPDRPAKHRDHDRVNAVLARLVDVVQSALVEVYDARGYATADHLLGSFDESLTLVGLSEARTLTWRNATALTDARWGLLQRAVDWRVRAVTMAIAAVVLAPSADPTVLAALRRLERDELSVDGVRDAFRARLGDHVVNR